MNLPRVPEILVGGLAALPELFLASAKWRAMGRDEVKEIIRLVPTPIRELPCFLDRLTSLWRYDYGDPFVDLPSGGMVLGTNMYHEVDRLLDVIDCARRRLEPGQLANYLQRLTDPKKHEDLLVEFAPILRLDATVKANYEVTGYGEGNKSVDWLIQSERVSLLLDVKSRTRDLLESFARLQVGERAANDTAPAPTHDPALLFKSIESKFKSRSPSEFVQGVWVVSRLKQEEAELQAAFATLDPSRVHVAILGDWEDDVYVLANDAAARASVLELLQLRESKRAVFRRGDA